MELPEPEVVDLPVTEPPRSTRRPVEELLGADTPTAKYDATPPTSWPRGEMSAARKPLVPLSVSEIDFGDYAPSEGGENRDWSTLRSATPAAEAELVPLSVPDVVETRTDAARPTKRSAAALPAPVTYAETVEPVESPVAAGPPALPEFARSWWFRFKSWFNGWRVNASDIVQLSVFGPAQVSPGQSIRLQVFAHLPETFDSVYTLSRAFHGDSVLLATGYVNRPVERGANLSLQLKVTNAGVAHSLLTLAWLGQSQPRAFDVHVPWESPAGLTPVALAVGANGQFGGEIAFQIHILPRRG